MTAALERVLQLGDPGVQAALQTTVTELTATWRLRQKHGQSVPTQTLGRLVFESGFFEALRYPSARDPQGFCLAVFPERVTPPSVIEVFDPYRELIGRIPPSE